MNTESLFNQFFKTIGVLVLVAAPVLAIWAIIRPGRKRREINRWREERNRRYPQAEFPRADVDKENRD